ncbi:type I DNA topoisomerase [Candidatus Absconditicoccus praedator]|uniref:type I DNA topoisomerase n=1 Tax=Candidatus Absconditicoccus praedator TaxID=2735562 RepID=UPI001E2E0179|nr:type I DNA topoisomerase [Candidatus Absconditicoccus praedator]UFX82635.1 type I DNA topoisomerase [Candidatus Absconditicoccus praedator]
MPTKTKASTTKKSTKSTTSKTTTSKKSTKPSKGKNLVIVESPAKSNTIKKFLGNEWAVEASMGHVVDLPKKGFGVDIDNNFKPEYETMPDKKKTVNNLKKLVKSYEKIWIATDEDREGEAIGWHLINVLNLKKEDTPRIVFHEITKDAIQEAVKNPRTIDENLVSSQQARRILDRLVGFKISPVLWSKVKRGLSAGRVQSVAVKLIVEKEREIQNFKPEESWSVLGLFSYNKQEFKATLEKINGKKISLKKQSDLQKIFDEIGLTKKPKESSEEKTGNKIIYFDEKIPFQIIQLKKSTSKRSASAPFITSTLQQEASNKLGWGVKQVMSVAQKLYENGYITYMRTDSLNLSSGFINSAGSYIKKNYGKEFVQTKNYKTKSKGAQEAHEAIRPTDINKTPKNVGLSGNEAKLYTLIWTRSLATQMADAKLENLTLKMTVKGKNHEWSAKGQTIKFLGFMQVWQDVFGKIPMQENILPPLQKDQEIESDKILSNQHFTKPPARYTEATLVKKLESEGIGRPSTYAPTISTIIDRGYVEKKDDKKLHPTDIAFLVNDFLESNFKSLMDYNFTAKMEDKLDKISEGKQDWEKMLKEFWKDFEKDLQASDKSEKAKMYVGEKCPKCGGDLVYKFGKTGKFIGCDNYPDCKYVTNTKEEQDYIQQLKDKYEGKPCPEGGNIVVKVGRYGPFLASDKYPEVKWIGKIPDEKTEKLQEQFGGETCDKCGEGKMVVKKGRRGPFLACDKYPDCKNAKPIPKKK